MRIDETAVLRPIGRVHSNLTDRDTAPKQGWEAATEARIEIYPELVPGLDHTAAGDHVFVLTWLHQGDRSVLRVHPRDDVTRPLTGVFATRSADRPNPIGLHRVTVIRKEPNGWLTVRGLEAVDSTPVIDIKPVLECEQGVR
jgi:tRNA-Thr(GGU) m(6)t(6)A37 methyltransferase TsaA